MLGVIAIDLIVLTLIRVFFRTELGYDIEDYIYARRHGHGKKINEFTISDLKAYVQNYTCLDWRRTNYRKVRKEIDKIKADRVNHMK